MSNLELLKSWGFFENEGWLCNPKIEGEPIFQVEKINDYEMKYIVEVISATAFNAGSRWKEKEMKQSIVKELEKTMKKIKKDWGLNNE